MKKWFRKATAIVLTSIMAISLVTPAFADDAVELYAKVDNIAKDSIQIEVVTNKDGVEIYTYSNLDNFRERVSEEYPSIDNYTMAQMVMQYTNQDMRDLPQEEVLLFLDYDSITSTRQYMYESLDGNIISSNVYSMPRWDTPDGHLSINTSYAMISDNGNDKTYRVWAFAEWLDFPSWHFNDALALTMKDATFENDEQLFGYARQGFECNNCGRATSHYRSVETDDEIDNGLELHHSITVPGITFWLYPPACGYCGSSNAYEAINTSYIRYGITTDETCSVQAGYGHAHVGGVELIIGVGSDRTVNFSGLDLVDITQYDAPVLTIDYN